MIMMKMVMMAYDDDDHDDILSRTGYYQDGVPVYGLCKDSTGMVSLTSLVHDSNHYQ